eukprot:scaffold2329_cov247-Pinguiococcus_pyrenoidosus.AAC.15
MHRSHAADGSDLELHGPCFVLLPTAEIGQSAFLAAHRRLLHGSGEGLGPQRVHRERLLRIHHPSELLIALKLFLLLRPLDLDLAQMLESQEVVATLFSFPKAALVFSSGSRFVQFPQTQGLRYVRSARGEVVRREICIRCTQGWVGLLRSARKEAWQGRCSGHLVGQHLRQHRASLRIGHRAGLRVEQARRRRSFHVLIRHPPISPAGAPLRVSPVIGPHIRRAPAVTSAFRTHVWGWDRPPAPMLRSQWRAPEVRHASCGSARPVSARGGRRECASFRVAVSPRKLQLHREPGGGSAAGPSTYLAPRGAEDGWARPRGQRRAPRRREPAASASL